MLIGLTEIANHLGITRQRVFIYTRKYDDFPSPIATLSQGRIWDEEAVAAWFRKRGRQW